MAQKERLAELVVNRLKAPPDSNSRRKRIERVPSLRVMAELFDTLFFLSIKTEEARPIQVRVFYVDPDAPPRIRMDRWRIFPLATHIPFTVSVVAKMAKAADPWSSGLAVFHTRSEGWFIWGMVDQVFHISMAFVQESEGSYSPPGLFHALLNGPADISVFRQASYVARLVQDAILEE